MYATCLFCNASLGANEAIEHFPVGKRLAYDAAKGRLWVVCSTCDRWNLSPLETRWEAIEEAERKYRDTKKRVATDNIGLARLHDGTDLIRIGAPLRPEFAAWRYGDTFGKRRSKTFRTLLTAGAVSGVAAQFGTHVLGLAFGGYVLQAGAVLAHGLWLANRVKVRVVDNTGMVRTLTQGEAWSARYELDRGTGALKLLISSRHGVVFPSALARASARVRSLSRMAFEDRYVVAVTGDHALRALSNILPAVNNAGGDEKQVSAATELVERASSPAELFWKLPRDNRSKFRRSEPAQPMLFGAPPAMRLALEMSLHEDDERRAMEGELHELEQRWKDAEQIAHIADALLQPAGITDKLTALRRDSSRGGANATALTGTPDVDATRGNN